MKSPARRLSPALALLIPIIPCLIGDHTLFAQRGDRKGHEMPPPPAHWKIPAAPVVTADQAPETFAVPEGFRVELIAAEPTIHDPVALAFDGNGRIWVVEMRGYMPNIDGKGEDAPTGRISVLIDDDNDGKIDRHTVFLDKLAMPRAVSMTNADRAMLYADGETLYEVAIQEGKDGLPTAGKKTVVDSDYAKGGNPEHKPNGLLHGLDNWIYSSKCDKRYRRIDGKWIEEKTEFRGQWGIDQDDFGRLYTNTNSNCVSAEELPPGVTVSNPNHTFVSISTAKLSNQSMWPSRPTPGVNRGYLPDFLSDQGYLKGPTAVSGLSVYRGDQFPAEFQGNLFINEPGGNLVKRAIVTGKDGRIEIKQAYADREFFTSTDERCRIVNSYTAPDGTLYFVDFYRGILQHAAYMTTFLRRQVEERGLDKPAGLGRLWRVVHEGKPPGKAPRMQAESSGELVAHLAYPNGWWRDTAQRLIVERGPDQTAIAALKTLAADGKSGQLARIHAIWTLEGLGAYTIADFQAAYDSNQPEVAAQALRAAGIFANTADAGSVVAAVGAEPKNPARVLRQQALASLGRFSAWSALPKWLSPKPDSREIDLLLSGLSGRELTFLETNPAASLTAPLMAAAARSTDPAALTKLISLAISAPAADQGKLISELASTAAKLRHAALAEHLMKLDASLMPNVFNGLLAGKKALGTKFKPIAVKALPSPLSDATALPDAKKRSELAAIFTVSATGEATFIKTAEDRQLFDLGKQHYTVICGACHQPHGKGQEFIAPPLIDSEWVSGPANRLIALTLDGAMGPITVDGTTYTAPQIQPVMPGLRSNPEIDDHKLAAMLTYVRNEWGNAAPPITPGMVKAWRDKTELRAPYTEAELKKIK
jgi:glucose/arabinose dehydrogenase/mono/diheme cytochrome c family protein